MTSARLKVGELARRTGLSVRTLHYYEEIGLLRPARTPAGHRLYGEAEVQRLQQIVALRDAGLGLDEVRVCLAEDRYSPGEVLGLQAARLRERIAEEQAVLERVERVAAMLRDAGRASLDDLVEAIRLVTATDRYFTPSQRRRLEQRKETVGTAAIARTRARWSALVAEVRDALAAGTDPADPQARRLVDQWDRLRDETVAGFTGGDAGLQASLQTMWRDSELPPHFGLPEEVVAFIARARGTRTEDDHAESADRDADTDADERRRR